MESAFLSSIVSKTSQAVSCVRRWAVSPSSSSDPRSHVLKDLEKLERTLKRIRAVLHDAEEREIREESVKLWLKELKEVAYEADDVLDEYQYEVLRAQVEGRASRNGKRVEGDDAKEVSIPDGMGDRIRDIRERFDEISQDRERLRLREGDGERRVLEAPYPAPTSHKMDESAFYERERDKQEVINLLFSDGVGNGISVVPIVGMGGLGKTTIAQLVYNDSKVKENFDLTGWVCVSDDFDVKRLAKDIIESFTKNQCHLAQLSTLQDTLEKKVKGKKVLLVLDDVWNEQQSYWESLRNPFVGAETVRIIVTCRNDSVAEIMQTVRPYHPRCLSPEQSWSLFRHYAFRGRNLEEQVRLTDMGKQIVEKCSGLPLAVKSIGSLLRYTADEDSWMDVMQSDVWEIDENNEILPALRLSYSRMPAHLKPCFVYCSMFPKDYVFDKDELVRLWMAQGYIQTSRGTRRLEDIGNEYFIDLQRRSFFDSHWSNFKMHDMIHDLAKSIAGNECWAIVDKKLPSLPNEVRHLYVKDREEFVKSLRSYNFSTLRTLLKPYSPRFPTVIQELMLLRFLRTLEFCWERKHEIPDFFGHLKHLRNLYIISYYSEKFPDSVCLLYHLQILVLDCKSLVELPDELGNLTNLRYFKLFIHFIKRLPGTVCQLRNLQTLVLDCPHLAELPDDLGNCTNLRYLHITSNKIEKLPKSICLLYNLQAMELDCQNLAELPYGLGNLTNLHHLQIANRVILCLPAGIGKLTKLQIFLGCYKVQGGIGVLKDFMNLQGFLSISGLRNLVNIENAKDAGLKHKHKLKELFLYWNAVDCKNDPYHNRGLHLEAFSEENKDIPADEKREEAMLEYLQPHANLEILSIQGYGGSKFPKWVGDPFSFGSLKNFTIENCKKISSLDLYIHESLGNLDVPISTSMLESVDISGCLQLTSIAGLHHLHLLKYLKIYNCPQLRLLSEEGLPSNVRHLHIGECQQLTLVLQSITYLNELIIQNCPKLNIMAKDQLSSFLPFRVQIIDYPGLSNWCQVQKINCIQVASGNKLTISNTWENIMHAFDDLTSVEHFCFSNSWKLFQELSIFEELTIWDCTDIPLYWWPKLASLRSLVIKNCHGVQVWEDKLVPSMLKSLLVDSCEELTFLLLVHQNRYAFEELQLVNCPKLERVEGLNFLFHIKILRIERCPRLRLPQDDLPHLIFLRSLVIKDCPGVRVLQDRLLPSTLESLVVDSYEELTFLRLAQQNRYAFEELQLVNCSKLERVEGLNYFFLLKNLRIERCPRLQLPQDDLPQLIFLRSLVIKDCPGVRVLQNRLLPSTLESLVVDSCEDLTFLCLAQQNQYAFEELQLINCPKLEWVEGLNCLFLTKILRIERCPRLRLPQDDRLSSMPYTVKIVDCLGLSNWCQIQRINCIQVASGNKLTTSNTWENIMHGFDDLTSVEHLCFSNSWELFLRRDSISVLEELTIWGCTKIPPLRCLPNLTSLRSLVIKDCPGVRVMEDKLFPSTLKFLVVDSCEGLTFLMLAQQNRYKFEELQLVNCPKLIWVEGLNCLFFPKILRIDRCPQLQFPQDDRQTSIPPHVEIAEETENKETIDDGTKEKQVLDCVMIEHANSAVSSMFDVADDCSMGCCSSQPLVQITAEPLANNSVVSSISDDVTDCNMDQFLQLGFLFGCSSQSPL
ncbi:putative disease resistance protein RGA4 isoform X2 [Phoenix dactylifera]|uniref:Disease resistance protein RGA4 isoform X2 n=1 Tax=Phoenix dactylifera TaxID=42345 RepID=A0A8B9A1S7_PHODC|nr:putative disease resistance protein RGA4 isoform X2 [Phoenix dactylifera]